MSLVTRGDVVSVLLRIIQEKKGPDILHRLALSNTSRVKKTWAQSRDSIRNWYEIPEVEERQNRLITGAKEQSVFKYTVNLLSHKRNLEALSLGCGTGTREIAWAETGIFKSIKGIDISEKRIMRARENSSKTPAGGVVQFDVADIRENPFGSETFDMIIAEGILHHISPLEPLVEKVLSSLRRNGILVLNEYVGPDRFQWAPNQIRFCNALLSLVPIEFRTYRGTNVPKRRVFRPGTLSMRIHDPSEAVESSRIINLVHRKFKVISQRDYGGTILHPLLKDIAHHFIKATPITAEILRFLFDAEDYLMKIGAIRSDFTFLIAQKT